MTENKNLTDKQIKFIECRILNGACYSSILYWFIDKEENDNNK